MRSTAPLSSLLVVLLTGSATWQPVVGEFDNLLNNPSFEDEVKYTWEGIGFKPAVETGTVLHGSRALLVQNRKNEQSGPGQSNVKFEKGRHYGFEGYVKLLNDVKDKMWQVVKANIQVVLPDGTPQGYNIAYLSFCNTSQGWIKLKGDMEAPQVDFTEPRLTIRGPDTEVNFLVDNVTLYELPEDPHWRQKADANIEKYRKANILINVNLPDGVPASEVEVEVSLKHHQFAFGAMLRDSQILKSPTTQLMQIAYSWFQWASVQNYKWKYHKGNPLNNSDLSIAIRATLALKKRGMKVRGHSIFWDVDKNIPEEVKELVPAKELPNVLHRHLQHVMKKARNIVSQWDVQNEHIAMHYYEEKSGDPEMTKDMFQWARNMNDSGKLYLNEFQCVTSGAQTEQLHHLAKEYLAGGIPLQGVGCQGHTKSYVKPDPTAMWRRISRLAEVGLPVMMTEFDLGWPDRLERADWFEDSIRAFFGHPSLRGVILWDFWNATMRYPDKELVRGSENDLEILESGQRWACLVNKEWNTHQIFQLKDSSSSISLRGFQGTYELLVKRNGQYVQKETFNLDAVDATWYLDVVSSEAPIEVTPKQDFVKECVSHREQRSLGIAKSTSKEGILTCSAVSSTWSESGVHQNVSVSCPAGEVMTACMSITRDSSWAQRKGEKMEVDPNTREAQCTAYSGHEAGQGVKAFAICCKGSELSCDYQTAGPSFPMDGAMAEATCASGRQALGCSSYSSYPMSDGVWSREDLKACRAQSGGPHFSEPEKKSGVLVYSACCKTKDRKLNCTRVESSKMSALASGSSVVVTCPEGTVLTGCNVFAEDGKAAGAKVLDSTKCRATLGADLPAGSTGVRAYATCCSL